MATDITDSFVRQLQLNGAACEQKDRDLAAEERQRQQDLIDASRFGGGQGLGGAMLGNSAGVYTQRLRWFAGQVGNRRPWDFKNNIYARGVVGPDVAVAGHAFANDTPGNVHYGFVGRALRIGRTTLTVAAGVAQVRAGTAFYELRNLPNLFDDPRDTAMIEVGMDLYDDLGLKVTAQTIEPYMARLAGELQTLADEAARREARKRNRQSIPIPADIFRGPKW